MPANFICQSAIPNNGIMRLHLSVDRGQPNDAYFNVTLDVLSDMTMEAIRPGDEVAVQFTVIRHGGNGMQQR